MLKKISVIIPTFNRGWSILEAVGSVIAQDYYLSDRKHLSSTREPDSLASSIDKKNIDKNFEIIVVDDGSTDNTNNLLKPLADKGVITLLRQGNKGVSAARNLGISHSHGDFIAFLDSDDLWLKDKLSCQIDFFNRNLDAMICQTEEIWIRNGKRVNPKYKHKKLSGMIFEPSLHLCLVSPSAVMVRREFFDIKGLFDETLPACEDYDLWLRTSIDMPIWLVDRPCIIKKGGHDDQLSSSHSLDKYRIRSILNLLNSSGVLNNTVLDKTKKQTNNTTNIRLSDVQTEAAIKVLREKCTIYSQGCLKRGKIEEAEYYNNLLFSIK